MPGIDLMFSPNGPHGGARPSGSECSCQIRRLQRQAPLARATGRTAHTRAGYRCWRAARMISSSIPSRASPNIRGLQPDCCSFRRVRGWRAALSTSPHHPLPPPSARPRCLPHHPSRGHSHHQPFERRRVAGARCSASSSSRVGLFLLHRHVSDPVCSQDRLRLLRKGAESKVGTLGH